VLLQATTIMSGPSEADMQYTICKPQLLSTVY
jgi:hypothetical protein